MKKMILAAIAATAIMSSCNNGAPKANLKTDVDTLSYAMGMSTTQGLKTALAQQYGVDTTYIDEFLKGVKEGALAGDDKKKHAYLIGLSIGQQISQQMVKGMEQQIFGQDSTRHLSIKNVLAGFFAGVKGKGGVVINGKPLDPQTAFALAQPLMESMRSKQMSKQFGKEKKAGEAFMAQVAKQPGVKSLGSGVYYKVEKEGTGKMPSATDTCQVVYELRLPNGKVIDSSNMHGGKPAEMTASGVVKGFGLAMTHMPEGSTWDVFVPASMGYGDQGGGELPPYSTLIFKITLVKVK